MCLLLMQSTIGPLTPLWQAFFETWSWSAPWSEHIHVTFRAALSLQRQKRGVALRAACILRSSGVSLLKASVPDHQVKAVLSGRGSAAMSHTNMWLGADETEAAITALEPKMERTATQLERLLAEITTLEVCHQSCCPL